MNQILGNKKAFGILALFLEKPLLEISQKEIIGKAGIAKATAVKWLNMMIESKYLILKRIGVTNLYRLDNENVIIKELKKIFIISSLENLKKIKNVEIYLYGSCSRGENTENSDIDLLILGKIERKNIVDLIENIAEKIGKSINFRIYSSIEWAMMQKKDKAYFERVEKDKIRLI